MDGNAVAKARILVVDDSKLMRKAAHKMLGEEFDVVTADDGELAWTQIVEDPSIQVVFTDLNMPNLDGYELLQRIRKAEDGSVAALPVIVVTGAENDEAARMSALDMGATDFITKPFTTVDLLARARAHANNQRITRRLQAQSNLDALTGLANLAGFQERLQQDISFASRHHTKLSVVRVEIVEFRRLFLYHGRAVADALLLQVARLLRARIRTEDSGGRVGLGGFALSMPAGDAAGIETMLARLYEELLAQPPLDEQGQPIPVVLASAVLGVELADHTTPRSLLAECEALLAVPAAIDPSVAAATAQLTVPATVATLEAAPAVDSKSAEPAPELLPAAPARAERVAELVPAGPERIEPVAAPVPVAAAMTEPVVEPLPTPSADHEPLPATVAQPAAPAAAAPLRLDPLLDQLASGDTRAVTEKLPQVISRLLPIFRLLGPNQRAQLIQFLQRLG